MVEVFFGTPEELEEHMASSREAADAAVREEQILQPGDCYVAYERSLNLFIYGEILDAAEETRKGRELSELDEDETAEYHSMVDIYSQPHMKYFRFARAYSPICPDGELGDVHLCTVGAKISRKAFDLAKAGNWPQDKAAVRELVYRITD